MRQAKGAAVQPCTRYSNGKVQNQGWYSSLRLSYYASRNIGMAAHCYFSGQGTVAGLGTSMSPNRFWDISRPLLPASVVSYHTPLARIDTLRSSESSGAL